MHNAFKINLLLLLLALAGSPRARAQWTTQTITLQPGWNSVALQLQPEPADCATVFAGQPVESVWGWNRRFSTVQFIQNPGDLIPGQKDWVVWGPGAAFRVVANLFNLQAEHVYMIKVASNSAPITLRIQGRPVVRTTEWVPDSFNFVGLHVDPASPPLFRDYFAPSVAHAGQPIFRLTAAGIWAPVNPATERARAGEAYWVRCAGPSTYSGPLTITVEQGRSLDYGRSLVEQTLTIQNATTADRVVSIRQTDSAPPPSSASPGLAGKVPLSSWVMDYPANVGFQPLAQPLTKTIPAGGKWSVRLAVRRQDMAPGPTSSTNATYQSLLEIKDGAGALHLTPVTAQGAAPLGGSAAVHTGLWVGTATINLVSQGTDPADCPTCPIPTNTAAPFQFRLLVHEGTNGQANLLQHVYVAFKQGAGTNHSGGGAAGSYVLLTGNPATQTNRYDSIVRRFASAAFGFSSNIVMSPANAAFGLAGTTLSASVILGYDDPTNPFKHLYHPDHDNKDDAYNPLPATTNANWPADQTVAGPYTSESFTVTRYVTLQFTASDPEQLTLLGWGDTLLGGNYSETITGLHKNPLYIRGTFRLHLAAGTGVLN